MVKGGSEERLPFETGERETDEERILHLEVADEDAVLGVAEVFPVSQAKEPSTDNTEGPDIRRSVIGHSSLLRSDVALKRRQKTERRTTERKHRKKIHRP